MSSSNTSLHKRLFNAWLIFLCLLAFVGALVFGYIIRLQQQTVISELHREVVLVEQMLENRLLSNRRHAARMAANNSLRVLVQLQLWSQVRNTLAQSGLQESVHAAWILDKAEAVQCAYPAQEADFCPMTLSGPLMGSSFPRADFIISFASPFTVEIVVFWDFWWWPLFFPINPFWTSWGPIRPNIWPWLPTTRWWRLPGSFPWNIFMQKAFRGTRIFA
jgi:hypothetical protein